jgi:Glu-tRNA(Gln) amidotransferase subunit E-like FAD-binding protein
MKNQRYMFFSNLEQIKRQCEIMMRFDESVIEQILDNGHDWAQDHIAEAKNNMDQVFDFMMNEIEGDNPDAMEDEVIVNISEEQINSLVNRIITEKKKTKKKKDTTLCSRGINAAKAKYDVYPSAYANGYAVQVCKGTMPGLDGKKRCSGKYCSGK